jgi:catechol 2,3-dioxygenase-like lactoylglutathione lyase family enzyme
MTLVPAASSPSPSQVPAMAADYYHTNSNRRGLLGYVSFRVHSYETSKKFYTALLKPFGVDLVYDNPARKILGYGFDVNHDVVNVFERGEEAHSPGLGTHLAFNGEAVRGVWDAGIRNGGRSDGQPGIREGYGKEYYAAFLFDPDGFKLVAVFQESG